MGKRTRAPRHKRHLACRRVDNHVMDRLPPRREKTDERADPVLAVIACAAAALSARKFQMVERWNSADTAKQPADERATRLSI